MYRGATSALQLVAHGDTCRAANRILDALTFYQKAQHKPGVERIREQAMSMLFGQTFRALIETPNVDECTMLGRQALALKKYTFARYAFELGGDGEMAEEIGKIVGKEIAESNDDKT